MRKLWFPVIDQIKKKFDCKVYSVDGQPVLEYKTYEEMGLIEDYLNEKGFSISDMFYMHHKSFIK